ncbi:hypothetical protein GCM10023334_066630 [Nonomuraea thailandensis]
MPKAAAVAFVLLGHEYAATPFTPQAAPRVPSPDKRDHQHTESQNQEENPP